MAQNATKDPEIASPATDSISCMAFSPKANYLVAGSWDSQLRCWEVTGNSNTNPPNVYSTARGQISHDAPILSTCWSGDGTKVFTGGCDNKIKCWLPANNQIVPIGQHAAPVKHVFWLEELQCVCSGSWDKTVKYWDGRSPTHTAEATFAERIYAMDCSFPVQVVGTADRNICIYDIRKPNVELRKFPSPLKLQTRCIALFADKTGFALGSIEGRVAIHHVEEKDNAKNFIFKCHRETVTPSGSSQQVTEIYAINSITFHNCGAFATAGSDGTYHFWDKDSKQRLKQGAKVSLPIPCGAFSNDGAYYAYASSYDWSKGHEGSNPSVPNQLFVHPIVESDMKGKLRTNNGRRR
eukprot:TRINITY_DN490_c0_g1_i1.p1 TRINITY_DN490_c0_g1~~TRINITY_DN490_c0_g1_i1.p1  ORF type:complete len:352 (-),score=56.20 TRINITY_DN490_c0_g1_i1:176-1231(-)